MPTHIPKNSLSDLTFSREYAADLGNPRRSQRARKVAMAVNPVRRKTGKSNSICVN